MKNEIINKKANFNYKIEAKYIAGIILSGTEVKSICDGNINFNDSFCLFINNELWVRNFYIKEYKNGMYNHNPIQDRKLLLNKKEINKIKKLIKEKGYTIVPLNIFINDKNKIKIGIGIGKGKREFDKRQTIKERDLKREMVTP